MTDRETFVAPNAHGRLPWDHDAPDWGRFDYRAWHESFWVQSMHWTARGLYFQLLDIQWRHGFVPANPSDAAVLLSGGHDDLFQKAWAIATAHFIPHEADPTRLINARQAEERWRAIDLLDAKREGGRRGGKAKRRSRKAQPREQMEAHLEGHLEGVLEGQPDRVRVRDTSPTLPNPAEETERALIEWWIEQQPQRPPGGTIAKQRKIARRLSESASHEEVARAAFGMGFIFPYSQGDPWDLFDLERHFAKALAAGNGRIRQKGSKVSDLSFLDRRHDVTEQ